LWALETGARVTAADAGGVAREILARSRGTAGVRCARFARKEDGVVFDGGRFRGGFAGRRFDHPSFNVVMLGAMLFHFIVPCFFRYTKSCGVFGAFVRGVGFGLSTIGCAARFNFLGFFFGKSRAFRVSGANFFRFLGFHLRFVFEFGAADYGIRFCVVLSFFVLGLDEIRRERGDLVFA
jgi:hypothetical protein